MIRLWFCILVLLLNGLVMAQEFEQGPVYSADRKFTVLRLNGFYKGDLCLLKARTGKDDFIKDIRIDLFDTASLAHKSFAIWNDCFADRNTFFPEGVLNFNDSLMLFGSAYNKGLQEMELKVKGISPLRQNNTPDSAMRIFSARSAFAGFSNRRFRIVQEIQGRYLLMFYAGNPPDSDSLLLDFKVFDRQFKLVKEQHQILPKQGVSFGLDEISVDESANVFALLHWKSGGKNQQKSHFLYAFPSMADEVVEYELALDDFSTEEVRMHLASNGKLWLAGIYFKSRKAKEDQPEGIYLLSFDLNGSELKQTSIRPFSKLNYWSEDRKERSLYGDGYLENLHLVELSESGGLIPLVVLEQQRSEEICQTDFRSNMLVCNQHYFADAVVLYQPTEPETNDRCFVLLKKQHLVEDEQVFLSGLVHIDSSGAPEYWCNANAPLSVNGVPTLENPETAVAMKMSPNHSAQNFLCELPLHVQTGKIKAGKSIYLLGDGRGGNCIYRVRN
jgi:hypothetical protein